MKNKTEADVEAVQAKQKLIARQAAYQDILEWEGRLHWEGDESIDWRRSARASGSARHEAPPGAPHERR